MAIDALVKPLLALPLFKGLTPLQLTEIVWRAERIIYRPGDVIVAEDEPSDAAIVIVSGNSVRINETHEASQRQGGEPLPEGVMIAELAMFIEIVHTTTVIAQSQVKALRLTQAKMHELMQADNALAQHFSACIITRLKDLAHDVKAVDSLMEQAAIAPLPPQTRVNVPVEAHPA
ncbi:cyclic nucleotide-binding domain-containing protein [Hyphomicrobium sp.]|uniref:cyclic nucleotide-binding domain-containing protein n=1 Tax=Hyphomicrobium sp. TaxID=82 RepID=UPI002D79C9C2|nr:cyclic nucleotide-binding domain-containing protein [Hyphomicrobium sp.]HET6388802.1 cyclic nucleotide-binding domain-containing protein [Hyphomicrobium sp.]